MFIFKNANIIRSKSSIIEYIYDTLNSKPRRYVMEMRRSQNEIKDREEIINIIHNCDVIRVGMSVDNMPYIVPLNFGFKDNTFYFHGAKEGRKIDMIKCNPNVCFELDTNHKLIGDSDRACDWTMKYASVMGTGVMTIIETVEDKKNALNILMQQYGGKEAYEYGEKMLDRIGIMKLDIISMTGKQSSS